MDEGKFTFLHAHTLSRELLTSFLLCYNAMEKSSPFFSTSHTHTHTPHITLTTILKKSNDSNTALSEMETLQSSHQDSNLLQNEP
jgi:hypothetical protein